MKLCKQKRRKRINSCLNLCDKSCKLIPNYVKPHTHNSDAHEIAKFKMCLKLIREGKEIYTEVKFLSGGRCDVLIPEDFRVIEILASETKKECLSKTNKYPYQLEVFMLTAEEILDKSFEL